MNRPATFDGLIIGGGAAGYFAGIHLARQLPEGHFVLLEATAKPLRKVLLSGGGRCNVTHACFDPKLLVKNYPRGDRELLGPMHRFGPTDTIAFFKQAGVLLKTESDGRMFPVTDRSTTIFTALEQSLQAAGCRVWTGTRVQKIRHLGHAGFAVEIADQTLKSKTLLIATGSAPAGYQLVESLGHEIVAPVPSLFTFKIDDDRLRDLPGSSFANAELKLIIGKQRFQFCGPLLITHWGLSGPGILKLSAFAARHLHANNYQAVLKINLLPDQSSELVAHTLAEHKNRFPAKSVRHQPFAQQIPKKYWHRIVTVMGWREDLLWGEISKAQLQQLAQELTAGRFEVQGKGAFKDEFVTAGGVKRRDIDFKTMQSRRIPGLFFAGEVIDIDGITGGFNFQNAWTTGWIAAQGMAAVLQAFKETNQIS